LFLQSASNAKNSNQIKEIQPNLMSHLKAIIFDVDGTLANTEETHRQAFNASFSEFDLPFQWSEQEYAQLLKISGGKERIYAYLKKHGVTTNNRMALREFSLKIHQRKSEIYREKLIAGHIGLRVGVERLLGEAIDKGIKIGVATCTSTSNVETLLMNSLGSDAMSYFDAVVTSDIVIDKKPSPVVYQFALSELGLDPMVCIAIEDTYNGNRAAITAGLKTVITTHAFTRNDDFEYASIVLDQLGDPGQPFNVISGNTHGSNYVDVQLLENIVAEENLNIMPEYWEPEFAVVAK